MKRKLTIEETKALLALTKDDIDMNLLRNFFAIRMGQDEARFNTFDTFRLPKDRLYNSQSIETTIGRYLWNFFVIPDQFLKKFEYRDAVFDKKTVGIFEKKLANMLLNDEINTEDYGHYLNCAEWITLGITYFISPTMDYDMNIPIPEVIKRKEELFEKYAKEIKEGDPNAVSMIEAELITLSRKLIKEKGNEGYDFFESGAFSFENNYKKTSIMGGIIENPYTGKLDVLKSNYMQGISQEEFPLFANSTITGGYARGVETQKAGYETKKINNAVQNVILDDATTDCGTTQYITTVIPAAMQSMFLYRYVLDGGKEVMLDEKNMSKFIGREIKMRSAMYCKNPQICNKCAGELYYKLGIKNAGLLASTMSGSLMNLALKKTHDQTIRFNKIHITDYITKR